MQFKTQISIDDQNGKTITEDIIKLDRSAVDEGLVGISLSESKQLLKQLQQVIVNQQASRYTSNHRNCIHCNKIRRIKGSYDIQYRTLFGTVVVQNLRLYHCQCTEQSTKTFSVLNNWVSDHNSPELRYIETKWSSLMSYGMTVDLLKDVLPINEGLNAETVRQHLHKTAKRQEEQLKSQPRFISGCQNEWAKLPKPDKPLTVGIDGGYVRDCKKRKTNFEVIVAKSFSKTEESKRLGFVQKLDKQPERRLMRMLQAQGLQANQQITFLSDGADNVRELQYLMHPDSEHILDWFHITMRLTVLTQFAKGLTQSDPKQGQVITKDLDSTKWYLWHGNTEKALDKLEDCYLTLEYEEITYMNCKKFLKHLKEMDTYIQNNSHLIPNYGEKYRYGETITTAFVESTVNEVIAKRMVKKQQMQWSHEGAHALLQTRTAVLNGELRGCFESWYPEMRDRSIDDKFNFSNKKAA
ncbi:MAG: hypothetical protein ACI9IA_000590 [Enterobacterales bacterium]|jgi:hypothetical protein